MVWRYDDPRWTWIDRSLIGVMTALFLASVLSWRGVDVFGSGVPFRPLSSVYLCGALLLQAIAGLCARKRWYAVSYSLLAISLVGLWVSITTRS